MCELWAAALCPRNVLLGFGFLGVKRLWLAGPALDHHSLLSAGILSLQLNLIPFLPSLSHLTVTVAKLLS